MKLLKKMRLSYIVLMMCWLDPTQAYAEGKSDKTEEAASKAPSEQCKQPEISEVETALSKAQSKLDESDKLAGSVALELLDQAEIYEEVARKALKPDKASSEVDSQKGRLSKLTEARRLRKAFVERTIARNRYQQFIAEVLAVEAGVAGFLGNITLKVDNDGRNSGLTSGAAMRVSVGPRIGPAVLALEGTLTFTFMDNNSAFSDGSNERADWRAGGLLRYDFQPLCGWSFAPGVFGGGTVLQRGTYVVDDEDNQLPRHAGAYGGLSLLFGGILGRTKSEDPSGPARRLKHAVLSYELMCRDSSQSTDDEEECERRREEVIAAGMAMNYPAEDCSGISTDLTNAETSTRLAASTLARFNRRAECELVREEHPPSGFFLGVDPRVDFVASAYLWQLSFSLGVVGRF